MFDQNNIFNTILIIPILNVLTGIYKLLLVIGIPGAFGISLILMTVLIRLILQPLTAKQIKSTQKLSQLKPRLDKLSQQYKNDKMRLQQEQLKLYQEAGINPAAGCLPLLIQMPVMIAIYNLFLALLNNPNMNQVVDSINKVVYFPFLKISTIDLSFFGMNLAHKPNEWQKYGVWFLAIPVITGVLQYYQTKLMTPTPPAAKDMEKPENGEKDKKKDNEDMAAAMQKQMAVMMPLMIGFFSYSFPLGLSLYWNTFTIFGIIQQYQLNKQNKEENDFQK